MFKLPQKKDRRRTRLEQRNRKVKGTGLAGPSYLNSVSTDRRLNYVPVRSAAAADSSWAEADEARAVGEGTFFREAFG